MSFLDDLLDGINMYAFYDGFFSYIIPQSSIIIALSTTTILLSFLPEVLKLLKDKNTIKDFPYIPLAAYLITSSFMFMYVFGTNADVFYYDIEVSTLCVIGKIGYFICMIWSSFFVYYYKFPDDKIKSGLCVLGFVVCSFAALALISQFLRIPYFNQFFISLIFTAFNLINAIDIKKIWETKDRKLFNLVNLIASFLLNSAVALSFCKYFHAIGFRLVGLFAILNWILVAGLLGLYIYLWWKFEYAINNNETKSDETKEKEKKNEEKKETVNDVITQDPSKENLLSGNSQKESEEINVKDEGEKKDDGEEIKVETKDDENKGESVSEKKEENVEKKEGNEEKKEENKETPEEANNDYPQEEEVNKENQV